MEQSINNNMKIILTIKNAPVYKFLQMVELQTFVARKILIRIYDNYVILATI